MPSNLKPVPGIHCVFCVDFSGTPAWDCCVDREKDAITLYQQRVKLFVAGKLPANVVEVCRYSGDDLRESTANV